MELKIKPFSKNSYPKRGLLIRSASPLVWFREIESLEIDLNVVQTFAIPSLEPNILYGCFLIFGGQAPEEIGKNSYFQCFDNQLFIPENTDFYPKINSEDWKNIDAQYIIMHPDFGLVKLNETIDWVTLLQESTITEAKLKKPSNSVFIPQKIRSFKVDMNDDELLEQLLNPTTDEDWMKNLPFDMEKLKAGDQAEILKYIEYITKYPERAVYLGIPLDIHSSLRDGFGNFDWGMFGGAGGEKGDEAQNERSPLKMTGAQKMFAVFLALIVVIIFAFEFGKEHASKEQVSTDLYNESTVEMAAETENNEGLIFQSGFTAIDMKVDSVFGNERRWLVNDYKQTFNTEGGKAAMLWKIEEYRAKEKKFRDSLKKMYLKKIEHVVDLKIKNYHKKILDSIQKDPSNKMSKISKELLADDILEMRKTTISDSLARIYGTNHETDPQIVFNNNVQNNDALKTVEDSHVKKEISFSEIVWLLLAVVGLVSVYSYFIRKKPFDMGGDYVSESIKLILIAILGSTLLYIFYPLIAAFGYNWLVWILIIGVIVLLYRLFSEDMDILKSRKK